MPFGVQSMLPQGAIVNLSGEVYGEQVTLWKLQHVIHHS